MQLSSNLRLLIPSQCRSHVDVSISFGRILKILVYKNSILHCFWANLRHTFGFKMKFPFSSQWVVTRMEVTIFSMELPHCLYFSIFNSTNVNLYYQESNKSWVKIDCDALKWSTQLSTCHHESSPSFFQVDINILQENCDLSPPRLSSYTHRFFRSLNNWHTIWSSHFHINIKGRIYEFSFIVYNWGDRSNQSNDFFDHHKYGKNRWEPFSFVQLWLKFNIEKTIHNSKPKC